MATVTTETYNLSLTDALPISESGFVFFNDTPTTEIYTLSLHDALPVFRGNGIETRLRPPGRMRGLAREQSLLERRLDRIEDLRLRFRQVAREIAQERGLVETPFIAVEDDPGGGGWRRKCLGQRRVILARIRRPRRHIDKGRHVRMYTGLCHDHAGKGMSDQNRRTILPRQHALGRGYRFRQRCQGVLHGRGIEPRCLQSCNHLGPG